MSCRYCLPDIAYNSTVCIMVVCLTRSSATAKKLFNAPHSVQRNLDPPAECNFQSSRFTLTLTSTLTLDADSDFNLDGMWIRTLTRIPNQTEVWTLIWTMRCVACVNIALREAGLTRTR